VHAKPPDIQQLITAMVTRFPDLQWDGEASKAQLKQTDTSERIREQQRLIAE
jgi:hypothetical protein